MVYSIASVGIKDLRSLSFTAMRFSRQLNEVTLLEMLLQPIKRSPSEKQVEKLLQKEEGRERRRREERRDGGGSRQVSFVNDASVLP